MLSVQTPIHPLDRNQGKSTGENCADGSNSCTVRVLVENRPRAAPRHPFQSAQDQYRANWVGEHSRFSTLGLAGDRPKLTAFLRATCRSRTMIGRAPGCGQCAALTEVDSVEDIPRRLSLLVNELVEHVEHL
jgi:hypothetical protein